MSKKQLWIMIGVAGAGKDYWIKNHIDSFKGNTKVISRDEIRFSMLDIDADTVSVDNNVYFSKEKEVYKEYINQICDGLVHNDIVIANATHLNEGSRSKLFRSISGIAHQKAVEINAMVIKTPLKTCLNNNSNRKGAKFVPEQQIKRMYSSLTIPTIEEGFDNIYVYKIEQGCPKYSIIQKEKYQ